MAKSISWLSVLLCALALAVPSGGCGDDDGPPQTVPRPDSSYSCIDNDGDFYGEGCFDGEDCDDTNPDITDQCRQCEARPIAEGCPCEPQPGMTCEPPPIPHAEGVLVCRDGARFCRDGFWTACEAQGTYILIRN